ncbi:MAG: hypothetical protein BGO29_03745 [Bacteroidales bacterium 36-12]|nr:MAG: hypothetical protein BGO29_03745 [Bacteroidales bacterium 36-12]
MADIKDLVSFICFWEGGYVDDPSDSGGPTNMGVTLKTWQNTGYDKMIKTNRINDIHEICKKNPKNLKYKRGWLNRIAAIKFMPLIMLFFLFGTLTGCRTTKKYTAPVEACVTENSITGKEITTDSQQLSAMLSDRHAVTLSTDSITETVVTEFKFSCPVDSNKQIISVNGHGVAVITRHKKTRSIMSNIIQHAEVIQQSDSTTVKTVATETKQTYLQFGQPVSGQKVLLIVLVILLLALWLYYVFCLKK